MSGVMAGPVLEFQQVQKGDIDGRSRLSGADKRWVAPMSIFDMGEGFGESVWIDASSTTWLSRRFSGAPVTCRWGRFRDVSCATAALTLQPKGVPNHFSATGRIRFAQMFLPDALVDRVGDELISAGKASQSLREDLIFLSDEDLDRQYVDYVRSATAGATPLELEARAILIVSRLLRVHHRLGSGSPRKSGGLAPWQIKRVCDAMEVHLHEDIALEALANLAGISATHFSRAFKQSMNVPPFTWLLQRRIARAKLMLADRSASLADIAVAVGFSAQPQFTTAFKRVTGMPPGAWRRELLS